MNIEKIIKMIRVVGENATTEMVRQGKDLSLYIYIYGKDYVVKFKQKNLDKLSKNRDEALIEACKRAGVRSISRFSQTDSFKAACFCKFVAYFLRVNEDYNKSKLCGLAKDENELFEKLITLITTDNSRNEKFREFVDEFNLAVPFESVLEYKYAKEFAREYDGEQRFKLIKGVYKMFKIKKTTAENVK